MLGVKALYDNEEHCLSFNNFSRCEPMKKSEMKNRKMKKRQMKLL